MLMKEGKKYMNVLQINNKKAEFLTKEGNYSNITDISKEDIYFLTKTILENETEIEVENDTDKMIASDVERVIYTNIRLEFEKILNQKETLNNYISDLFSPAYEKYKEDIED